VLAVELLDASELDKAATTFHRDGFVCIKNALTPEQLRFAQAGADRVIKQQTDADPERKGNRGHHRYSFNTQTHEPEWAMLIDLPNILAIIDKIWGSRDYYATGAGGDYSLPGAEIQPLHSDMGDFFHDPLKLVDFRDVPAPFIVVNYTMIDFMEENGAIRFIPGTQRSKAAIPSLADEPGWMKSNIVCAPANTAVVRDVRCWHGGTANRSRQTRPMTSVGYFAPWYRLPEAKPNLPRRLYEKLSPRGQEIARDIVMD
jgi:ectoine hydroxylase-related dioxygenase (phytanoyl-CoA dioxygenase family)